jgi:hypothetical protein
MKKSAGYGNHFFLFLLFVVKEGKVLALGSRKNTKEAYA